MPYCIYPGCKNHTDPKRKSEKQLKAEQCNIALKLSYHRFPRDPLTRQKWSIAIGLAECYITKSATICSEHFMHNDYKKHTEHRCLKETAIPLNTSQDTSHQSIVTANTTCEVEEVEEVEAEEVLEIDENVQEIPVHIVTAGTSCEVAEVRKDNVQKIPVRIVTGTSCEIKEVRKVENIEQIPVHIMTATPSRKRMRDSSTCITPSRLFNSPMKQRMREVHQNEIAMLKRKLHNETLKLARYKKKMERMEALLHPTDKTKLLSVDDNTTIAEHFNMDKDIVRQQMSKYSLEEECLKLRRKQLQFQEAAHKEQMEFQKAAHKEQIEALNRLSIELIEMKNIFKPEYLES